MAENCNECSIAWIRGSDYAEVCFIPVWYIMRILV